MAQLISLLCFLSLAFVGSCTPSDIIRVAVSKSPRAAAKTILKSRPNRYKYNPRLLARDIRFLKRNYNKLFKKHKKKVGQRWGKSEAKMPSSHQFVKYTKNYKSRAIINFDSGLISIETIETLNKSNSTKNLKSAIITTLLTPKDPRSVDMFSAKITRLSGRPYLYGLVKNHREQNIATVYRAENYANFLVKNQAKRRKIRISGTNTSVYYVKIHMINNHLNTRAKRYSPYVNKFARRYRISRSLVYAIMQTESNFNPYAISSAPAYGLMQIVPHTGGRDAYKKVHGFDKIPSSHYLLNYINNIQMGSAYINLLYYRYLSKIHNPVSREYCLIAAYNTGIGNVYSLFSNNRERAIERINRLSSSQIYQYLRRHLRAKEARDYLYKVIKARPRYVNF